MSERAPTAGGEAHPQPEFDRDIQVRRVVATGIWLAAVIAVSMAAMWFLSVSLRSAEQAADPPRSPLPEASARQLPPPPLLQDKPERDLAAMRQEEERVLEGYGWVDEAGGVARIPIERAIELIALRGLPRTSPGAAPQAPAAAAPPAAGDGGTHVP